MEQYLTIRSPERLMEPLLRLLEETTAVPLVITGGSMTPFLVHKRDIVYLSRADRPLKRGDMVLYQRDNGRYILHRVLRADTGAYAMIGDAQTRPEPGIRPEQIRALVIAVRRKGALLRKGSFWWEFFEKIWIRIVPLRPLVRNTYSFVKKLFCKKGAT